MKKISLFLFLALLFSIPTFSQVKNVDSKISNPHKNGFFSGVFGVVGQDKDGYYVLRNKQSGWLTLIPGGQGFLYLDYYNKDMVFKTSLKIEDIKIKIRSNPTKCFEFFSEDSENNLFLFHSEKEGDYTTLYKSKLNKKSFIFEKPELFTKLRNEKRKGRQGTFQLLKSDDKSKKAVISISDSENRDQSNLSIDYLDEKLNKISSLEEVINFPQTEIGSIESHGDFSLEQKTVSDIRLSNNGDLVLLAKTIMARKFFKGTFYDFHLISVSQNKSKPQYEKLNFKGQIPISAILSTPNDNPNNLRITGFYSSEKEYTVDGLYIIDFDTENLGIKNKNFKQFTKQQKLDFLVSEKKPNEKTSRSDRRIKKKLRKNKAVDIKSYYFRDQIPSGDGEFTIIAEKCYEVTSSVRNSDGTFSQVTSYCYKDLVFIHLNKRGEIEWVKNVGKDQVSGSPIYLGTYNFTDGEYIYFIYNNTKEKQLTLTSVSRSGDVQTKSLGENKRRSKLGKYYIKVFNFRKVNDHEVIGFANKSLKGKMIRLRF